MAAVVAAAAAGDALPTVTLSIVGTSDLHGRLLGDGDRGGLAVFAGYVANLRRARAQDGGAVVLVDAGDAFQGTLESNLNEGAAVVRAMNLIGYAAMAIGNHEFDYGPAGPASTPRSAADDPRGALFARASEARFRFLAANLADAASGRLVAWPRVTPSTIVEAGGIKLGIVGVTTQDTLQTTMAENVRDLRMVPLVDAIVREAAALRNGGSTVVVVAAHAGASCKDVEHPEDLASCDDGEILKVARALPPGTVDVIVAGHTHAGVAHRLNGIPIVESYSYGRAFGRVDLTVERATGRVTGASILPPRDVCANVFAGTERCDAAADRGQGRVPATYAGEPVVVDSAVAAALAPDVEKARGLRQRPLGVRIESRITRSYEEESALGNLFTDLMRAARPRADVALTNGGGLRADLEPGDLTYGALYEAFPFDNRFATLRLTGAALRRVLAANLTQSQGILSISGVRARAHCQGDRLEIALSRDDGRAVGDREVLTVVTSDFLAGGGEAVFPDAGRPTVDDELIREALVRQLEARDGVLRAEKVFDPARRRLDYPGSRPVRCGP